MKKLFFAICVLPLLLFSSCDLLGLGGMFSGNFWAINFITYTPYRVNAELLYEGTYCEVWVEKGSGLKQDQIDKIGLEYDTKIHGKMMDNFSLEDIVFKGTPYADTWELADYLVDGNGKICILLLDIKDGYKPFINESYIAGYFFAEDFFDSFYSNQRAIIYIDTYPGITGEGRSVEDCYGTLVHELQHLMHFVSCVYKSQGEDEILQSDIWIDEGLSSAAEFVYDGHVGERIGWFQENGGGAGKIPQGNNFYVWDNHTPSITVLDDYATVYLFFQWVRLQTGGNSNIYRKIISSEHFDHRAVTSVMGPGFSNWDFIIRAWLAANYINAPNGPYGYMDDPVLKNIRTPAPSSNQTTVKLFPGEGVYSIANTNPNLAGQGVNIKNVFLIAPNTLSDNFSTGSTLLTYNKNENPEAAAEDGKTTGVPIPAASASLSGHFYIPAVTGPFRIGAQDFLRQRTGEINE